jgi:hypothetical protein
MDVLTTGRKHIRFIKAPQGTPGWLALRQNGIGGSEIGGVLGQSDYQDPIKIHLTKIGEPNVDTFTGNRFTRFGKIMEEHIAQWYQHWDVDVETMLINIENGKKLRRVRRVNGYYWNERWPWLYVSLDRIVWRDPRGRILLETKNTTTMEKTRYKHGFNPAFYLQVQQQLMILEADAVDVAIYYDGNNFEVKPVLPDYDVQNFIAEQSKAFWGNILKAREIKRMFDIDGYYGQHLDFIPPEKHEAIALLQQLEPELTGSENEYAFIRDLVVPRAETIMMEGTTEQWEVIQQRLQFNKTAAETKAAVTALNEKLILSLGGYQGAQFGQDGKAGHFTWKPDKAGVRRLYVSPKLAGE